MKNYVQYHNTAKLRRPVHPGDHFQILAKKPIRHLLGNRVWLISGEGVRSPKAYFLRYVFTVEEVIDGAPNLAIGTNGHRFDFSVPLARLPWFKDFLDAQQNFSLGVREIQEQFLVELEALESASPAPK